MKIACISDMHGNLNFNIPEVDLLLIAGDLCPAGWDPQLSCLDQEKWLDTTFRKWLKKQPIKECAVVAGNHDWIWYHAPKLVPEMSANFHYLEDSGIELFGKQIYGTPWQPPFCDWAFNKEVDRLKIHWENIPEDVDILITHCPPHGILDETQHPNYSKERIGDKNLLERIKEIKPDLSVFGHNHGEHGMVEKDGVIFINCSMVDERYDLTREPIILET